MLVRRGSGAARNRRIAPGLELEQGRRRIDGTQNALLSIIGVHGNNLPTVLYGREDGFLNSMQAQSYKRGRPAVPPCLTTTGE